MPTQKTSPLPDLSMRIMLRILEEEGLDTKSALEAAGFPDGLPALPGEVGPGQEIAFQRAFVAATGYRPDLWVKTGLRYHLPSYGGLGMALITSQSLNEMVTTTTDNRELDYSLATVTPIWHRDSLAGEGIDVDDVPESLREFTAYRDIGAIMIALRDVWNSRFPLDRIEVQMPRPTRGAFAILDHEVTFGAERNAVVWKSEHSCRRLHYGDPVLHEAYLAECRTRSRVRGAKDDLVEVLEQSLMRGDGGPLTLTGLAADTGHSERTLQRRLLARGVKFRDLADEARRRVAIELLTTTSISIAEIAWRLGYSEATSFNHAFRRWTGVSPATVRRGQATERIALS